MRYCKNCESKVPNTVKFCPNCGGQVVFPGDILVGDRDGIVVVRRQDAAEVAEIAIAKKAKEDETFALMASDLEAYAKRHLATTAKRFQGREPAFVDSSYVDTYGE